MHCFCNRLFFVKIYYLPKKSSEMRKLLHPFGATVALLTNFLNTTIEAVKAGFHGAHSITLAES